MVNMAVNKPAGFRTNQYLQLKSVPRRGWEEMKGMRREERGIVHYY